MLELYIKGEIFRDKSTLIILPHQRMKQSAQNDFQTHFVLKEYNILSITYKD